MQELGVGWITVNEILDFRGSANDGDMLPEEAIIDEWACQYPFQRLMISANGVIIPCTGNYNEEAELVLGWYQNASEERTFIGWQFINDADSPDRSKKFEFSCLRISAMSMLEVNASLSPGCRNCRHGAVKHGVEWVPED